MAHLSNQGRDVLSTNANDQKTNGINGNFGYRNAPVAANANGVLNGPAIHGTC